MGYIDSNKNLWSIALTKKGKEYLSTDSNMFSLDRFSLSDSEINYSLVKSTDGYDFDVITSPVLEASTLTNVFSTSLIRRSYFQESDFDTIPEFEWRIDALYDGSNVFKLDNTIDKQYFDVSFYYLQPNATSQTSWQLPHAAIVDLTSFLKYYSFAFNFEPLFPSNEIVTSEGVTSSPYWYKWEQPTELKDNIEQQYKGKIKNWQSDINAIVNSKWNISDKYVLQNLSYVSLPEYRSFDTNKANGVTFRLTVKKEMLSRIYQYMNEFSIEVIKDYIYINNNDPLIKPVSTIYGGSNRYTSISKRIPIYITTIR